MQLNKVGILTLASTALILSAIVLVAWVTANSGKLSSSDSEENGEWWLCGGRKLIVDYLFPLPSYSPSEEDEEGDDEDDDSSLLRNRLLAGCLDSFGGCQCMAYPVLNRTTSYSETETEEQKILNLNAYQSSEPYRTRLTEIWGAITAAGGAESLCNCTSTSTSSSPDNTTVFLDPMNCGWSDECVPNTKGLSLISENEDLLLGVVEGDDDVYKIDLLCEAQCITEGRPFRGGLVSEVVVVEEVIVDSSRSGDERGASCPKRGDSRGRGGGGGGWSCPSNFFDHQHTDDDAVAGAAAGDAVRRPPPPNQPLTKIKRRQPNPHASKRWADAGTQEHASIASFADFAIRLLSVGAPPGLVSGALISGLEEVGHSTLCFEVAEIIGEGGGGDEAKTRMRQGPGPLPLGPQQQIEEEEDHSSSSISAIEYLVSTTLKEGVFNEHLNALVAGVRSDNFKARRREEDGDASFVAGKIGAALETIVREELEHAK
jgi:hypothetical protein